jgi:hypothetical protein
MVDGKVPCRFLEHSLADRHLTYRLVILQNGRQIGLETILPVWQKDRLFERQTGRQTDWQADRLAGRQTGSQTDWQTDRQIDRQTGRKTDWQTDRPADRQTG